MHRFIPAAIIIGVFLFIVYVVWTVMTGVLYDPSSGLASDLDEATRKQIERGKRGVEILKQDENSPQSVAEMTTVLFALNNGDLDDIEVKKIRDFEKGLLAHLAAAEAGLMNGLNSRPELTDEVAEGLKKAIADFKATGTY